jgi:hypothetical protein
MSTPSDDQTPDQPEKGQPIYGFAPIGQPQPVLGYFPAEESESESQGEGSPADQSDGDGSEGGR